GEGWGLAGGGGGERGREVSVGGVRVEHVLAQHSGDRLQRALELVPIPPPVLATDLDRLNVPAHLRPPPKSRRRLRRSAAFFDFTRAGRIPFCSVRVYHLGRGGGVS